MRSIYVKKHLFHLEVDEEEIFGFEVPYLSAICVVICCAYCTRPDIAFVVKLPIKYILHQLGDILCYL